VQRNNSSPEEIRQPLAVSQIGTVGTDCTPRRIATDIAKLPEPLKPREEKDPGAS
jgi:hypothetical protein